MIKRFLQILVICLLVCVCFVSCDQNKAAPSTSDTEKPISASGPDTPSHTHSFGDWETIKAATCKADGQKIRYCDCGESQTNSIPKSEHSWSGASCQQPATCSWCEETNGVKLSHNIENGQCSMCGLSCYDELLDLLFEYGTYKKENIALNGTLMKEEYSYTVPSNFGNGYTCEVNISKLESSAKWPNKINLHFSPGMYGEGDGVLLYIDKASVKNQKYDWTYLGSGTQEISGQLYAPDFSSSYSLEWSNTNCSTSVSSKLAGYAAYEISNILNSAFSELLQKSDKGITVAHFGFEHFE